MRIYTLLIFIFSIISFNSNGNSLDSIQDTVPFENPDYVGYRIAITNLFAETKGEFLKISYTPINTGRKDLLFEKRSTPPPNLVVNFDESLIAANLFAYASEIKEAVMNTDFHLAKGKIAKQRSLKIPVKNIIDTPVSSESLATTELSTEKIESSELESPRKIKKEPEILTPKEAPVDDFENSLAVAPRQENTPALEYDENACSDLVFESIKIIKKSKNKVTLEYTIVNQGNGPASLINDPKKENKNMALTAHFSSREQLTRGSFTFGGDFLSKGLSQSNGRLFPGERYTNTIKLNLQKMTKFTPYIVLEMDPYLAVYECDKKNNKLSVKVGEGMK